MRSLTCITPLLLLVGCAASVEGTVDGQSVAALSSAYFTQSTLGSGDDQRTFVTGTATSIGDGCNAVVQQQQARNQALAAFLDEVDGETNTEAVKRARVALAQAEVDYATAHVPRDHWSAVISASAEDEADLDGADAEIDDADDVLVSVTLCHVTDHPVVEEVNGYASVHEEKECFAADDGDVELVRWVEDQIFEATATVALVESEDRDAEAGDVVVKMTAQHCPGLEEALEEFQDIAQDFAE